MTQALAQARKALEEALRQLDINVSIARRDHPTGFLSMEQTCGLRDLGYIASAPYEEDKHARFGPPNVITPAGLAILRAKEDSA